MNCYLKLPVLSHAIHGDNDFMGFYAGAKLAGSDDLYNADALTRAEAPLWEKPRFLPFVRPPFYAGLISPLRFFSYQTAYWIWQSASLLSTLLFIYVWPVSQRWITALACCWSVPLLDCFIMGQDVPIVMLGLAAALALFFRGHHFAAGCVFSLCLIKYNLFLPMPLLIIGKTPLEVRCRHCGGRRNAAGDIVCGRRLVLASTLRRHATAVAHNTSLSRHAEPSRAVFRSA